MAETNVKGGSISLKSTKQEMLNAYHSLLKELEEKHSISSKPEENFARKKIEDIIAATDSLSSEGVVREINNLKLEIGKLLGQLSEQLENEVEKYQKIKEALGVKEKELKEIYDIEKAAQSLSALIEAHGQKTRELENEYNSKREKLNEEIQSLHSQWEKEKEALDLAKSEYETEETKRRQREKENYLYKFEREKQIEQDKFSDEISNKEKEYQLKKEELEKDIAERVTVLAKKELELKELQKKVDSFPKEMETAVSKAVKERTEELQVEFSSRESLRIKEFEGERNVLTTKIESLEKSVKEQRDQIVQLSQHLERAYMKIQEMAVKAVGSFSDFKSAGNIQSAVVEQNKK